jgi:hypothetical protein
MEISWAIRPSNAKISRRDNPPPISNDDVDRFPTFYIPKPPSYASVHKKSLGFGSSLPSGLHKSLDGHPETIEASTVTLT